MVTIHWAFNGWTLHHRESMLEKEMAPYDDAANENRNYQVIRKVADSFQHKQKLLHLHLLGVVLQKLAWILRPGVRVSSFKLGKKKLNTVISWYTVLHQKFDGLSKLIFG